MPSLISRAIVSSEIVGERGEEATAALIIWRRQSAHNSLVGGDCAGKWSREKQ